VGQIGTGTEALVRYGVSARPVPPPRRVSKVWNDTPRTPGPTWTPTCPSSDDRDGRGRGDATTRTSAPARTCEGTIGRSARGRRDHGCHRWHTSRACRMRPATGRPRAPILRASTPAGPERKLHAGRTVPPAADRCSDTLRARLVALGHATVRRARRSGSRSRTPCDGRPNTWKDRGVTVGGASTREQMQRDRGDPEASRNVGVWG
jgi:hypothetical protein